MAKKNLRRGDNHPSKEVSSEKAFIGAEVDADTYAKFQELAKLDGRSVSSMLRRVLEEKILSVGDNHLAAK